jgi:hypothetical protein
LAELFVQAIKEESQATEEKRIHKASKKQIEDVKKP